MRTRRLFLALTLALLLVAPASIAQETASLSTEARSGERALPQATPVEPGDPITLVANASTPADDREWRAIVNASIDGDVNESTEASWIGENAIDVEAELTAPTEEGPHALNWTVVLQSRTSEEAEWTQEATSEDRVGFEVRERPPPPQAEDVGIEVRTGAGDSIDQIGNLTPGEQMMLRGEVEVPERNHTVWNVTMSAFIDGERVGHVQQTQTGAGTVSFPLQFTAPTEEGRHDLRWNVTVEYRDTGEETWTELTTEEDIATFGVQPLEVQPGPGIPWLWILLGGAILVGGGAGAYYMFRPPKQIKGEPRSQAMRDLEGGEPATASPQEPEVHPQVKILEARAEDIRRMIELARQRYEDGDITEHQFEQIKQNKEAELEELEAELDDYREQGGQGTAAS